MAADSKAIRRYVAGVERALAMFDATNEWADYIAFLSRLLKALQASPEGADVPFKSTIAKYLSQSLKPSMPSGVHSKALEVYNLIFSILGVSGLSKDLSVYLPGLSHTLAFASLTIRPMFLSLYDDYVLKLSAVNIRPALKAIILSLLPGIEEENSEDFEQCMSTFNNLRRIFVEDGSEEIFWQSLFLASITSTNRRAGVLVYLLRYLPKLGSLSEANSSSNGSSNQTSTSKEDIRIVTTPEPGLLVRCFATGLQDQQPLVQRGVLDLLVTHLPLNAPTLQKNVTADDLDILVSSAMSVVLRRDMSLNRRLWTWFTGSDDKREPSINLTPISLGEVMSPMTHSNLAMSKQTRSRYFTDFGLQSVVKSFRKMLAKPSPLPVERARPFRLLLSMMDRWIIGGTVVDVVFVPLLQDLQHYQTAAPSQEAFDEVFRSANVFFDGIESHMIASQLYRMLESQNLDLIEFIIANFGLEDDDISTRHIPMIALKISEKLLELDTTTTDESSTNEWTKKAQLARILDNILEFVPGQIIQQSKNKQTVETMKDWQNSLHSYYVAKPNTNQALPPISIEDCWQMLMRNVARIILYHLEHITNVDVLQRIFTSFENVISRSSDFDVLKQLDFINELIRLAGTKIASNLIDFEVTRIIARLVGSLRTHDVDGEFLSNEDLLKVIPSLVERFWQYLLPSTPQFHVESVELIWTLRMISKDLLVVDSTIMTLLTQQIYHPEEDNSPILRFGIFWNHTRLTESKSHSTSNGLVLEEAGIWDLMKLPLMHIVDKMDTTNPNDPFKMWLHSLSSLRPAFLLILEEFEKDNSNQHLLMLHLDRLYKLITIAHQSSLQSKDLHEDSGPVSSILELCMLQVLSEQTNTLPAIDSLKVIRIILDGIDGPIQDDIVSGLVNQLNNVSTSRELQNGIFDTLQAIFSMTKSVVPSAELMNILINGIAAGNIDVNLDKWITLLCTILPLVSRSGFFANLLKMTASFCRRIQNYFNHLQKLYSYDDQSTQIQQSIILTEYKNPERSITNLFAGLEFILAKAHTQAMDQPAETNEGPASPILDGKKSRSQANNRLTVILCMQDTIRLCGQVWFWRNNIRELANIPETKSFNYVSSRLRTRSRRILEHLIDAEPQECLETLMGMWVQSARTNGPHGMVLGLLQTLDGARPKFMMPATFNAIYNRTNPSALDQAQKSSLSVDVNGLELMAFLIDYVNALEDDLMEEIWIDCSTFLRYVLANPMPHRQILLRMLEFVGVLCKKMENTNFGEEARMRRELADLCARLFTAIFTIKPGGLDQGITKVLESIDETSEKQSKIKARLDSGNVMQILCETLPMMSNVLIDSDRGTMIFSGIATNITGPLLRAKTFPQNINSNSLSLLKIMSKIASVNKIWRKDMMDVMNEAKLFQSSLQSVEEGWIPLISQLADADKTLMTELLTRLTPPTTAGLMFGVGATAARNEADRRTQLNLKRIALVLLSADQDTYAIHLTTIIARLEELLTATPTTSPSSVIRSDIYLLLRTIALTFSQLQLVSIWPMVDLELRELFTGMTTNSTDLQYPSQARLQAAKLLDLLLVLKPDEFQLHEWLFVTDTVDAIYPPVGIPLSGLADRVVLDGPESSDLPTTSSTEARKPWLCTDISRSTEKPDALLSSFFRQLSIHAFEDTYSLQVVDLEACRQDLLADLFTDR